MFFRERTKDIVAVGMVLIATAFAFFFSNSADISTKSVEEMGSYCGASKCPPFPPPHPDVEVGVEEINTAPVTYAHPVLGFEILYLQGWYPVLEESPNGPFEFSNVPPGAGLGSKVSILKTNSCKDSAGWREMSFEGGIMAEKILCKDGFRITLATHKEVVIMGNASLLDLMASTFHIMNNNDARLLRNWKTYRNERYGFEVKYPREWLYTEDVPAGGDGPGDFFLNFNNVVTLSVSPGSLEDIFGYVDEETIVQVNGIKMSRIPQSSDFGGWQGDYTLRFQKDDLVYAFSEGFSSGIGDKPKIEALYSTFKFFDKNIANGL